MALAALVILLGGGLVWLALRLHVAAKARAEARARYLDRAVPMLARLRRDRSATGFARLSGEFGGVTVDLQAVPDMLTFRKLPALWLLVTVPGPLPLRNRLNLMVRPTGVEPFSNFGNLPRQIALPEGFPADAALRCDGAPSAEEAAALRRQAWLFADEHVKELVLAPEGLRITLLADEANRTRYLLFREAELGSEPLAPDVLQPLLARALAIRADLLGQQEEWQCA